MIELDTVGHGEPLVLLHGVGANRGIWRNVIDPIAAERLVLAPDLPGFGDSPPVGAGFRLHEIAGALADVLSEHVTEPFDLVGNSLGSGIGRRLLLWGTIAAPQQLSAQDARRMLQASRGASRVGAAVAAVLAADLRSELARLDLPLGLIWGERDRIVPIATLQSILAVRPEVVVETIPDAAHVPQLERPAEFVAALRSVLDRL
jgi:pimeloyl-ACP methyl ester carboxylesterase